MADGDELDKPLLAIGLFREGLPFESGLVRAGLALPTVSMFVGLLLLSVGAPNVATA